MNGYKIGRQYVWQNLKDQWAYLNGQKTVVTGPMVMRDMQPTWLTDTPHPRRGVNGFVVAYAGELVPV